MTTGYKSTKSRACKAIFLVSSQPGDVSLRVKNVTEGLISNILFVIIFEFF